MRFKDVYAKTNAQLNRGEYAGVTTFWLYTTSCLTSDFPPSFSHRLCNILISLVFILFPAVFYFTSSCCKACPPFLALVFSLPFMIPPSLPPTVCKASENPLLIPLLNQQIREQPFCHWYCNTLAEKETIQRQLEKTNMKRPTWNNEESDKLGTFSALLLKHLKVLKKP